MNLKEITSLWSQYQSWLKQEGINSNNIQEKLPQFIGQLKSNPQQMAVLKNAIDSPQGQQLVKMLGLSDNDLNMFAGMLNDQSQQMPQNNYYQQPQQQYQQPVQSQNSFGNNLTKEQMDILRKLKR